MLLTLILFVGLYFLPSLSVAQDKDSVDVRTPPVLLTRIGVVYPESARRRGVEETVTVSALLSKQGTVDSVDVEQGKDPELIQEAIRALSAARFSPALDSTGEPLRVWYTQSFKFRFTNSTGSEALIDSTGVLSIRPKLSKESRQLLRTSKLSLLKVDCISYEILLSDEGEILDSKILSFEEPKQNRLQFEALFNQLSYSPAYLEGRPVPVYTVLKICSEDLR